MRVDSKVFASGSPEEIMHRNKNSLPNNWEGQHKQEKSAMGISIMRHEHCEGM